MKTHIALISALALSAFVACGKSSSSSDETPPANAGADVTPPASTTPVTDAQTATTDGTATNEDEASAVGETQSPLALNTTNLEFSRMQYDCGDIAAPVDASVVESNLIGAKSFQTLAATIPAKDKAMAKISVVENGETCDYRVLFSVNKSYTEVTYIESQALNESSVTACGASKSILDLGFGQGPVVFEYDKKFIRWVALHIPLEMQSARVCALGSLRAVFSGASI